MTFDHKINILNVILSGKTYSFYFFKYKLSKKDIFKWLTHKNVTCQHRKQLKTAITENNFNWNEVIPEKCVIL